MSGPVTTVGVGVVGAGPWGLTLARAFARVRGARLLGVADRDGERLARAGAAHAGVALPTGLEGLLATPGLDAVAVAVDSPRHHAVARRALEAGLHVLVEKPMALTVADGEELVALATRGGRVLMVGHVLLHHAGIERARALIDAGELGRVRYLHATRVGFGTVRASEDVWWSVAPHDVAVALHLFGALPATVSATGAAFLRADAADVASATLAFADGRRAQIDVSWLAPDKHRALTVVGERRTLVFDETDRERPLRLLDRAFERGGPGDVFVGRAGEVDVPAVTPAEPLLVECERFVEAIAGGARAPGDGASALDVLRVLEAGARSMRARGAPVAVVAAGPVT